jgi:hypothetical protein
MHTELDLCVQYQEHVLNIHNSKQETLESEIHENTSHAPPVRPSTPKALTIAAAPDIPRTPHP